MAKKRRKKFWLLKLIFQCFFIVVFLGCMTVAVGFYMKYGDTVLQLYSEAQKIVENSKESDFKSTETSLVYDAKGNLLKTLKGEKDLYYLSIDRIPDQVKESLISIEDKKFYQHNGIDVKRIAGSAVAIAKAGSIVAGGSTITQQMVKNVYLTNDQKWTRKVKEIFIALGIEKKYSKDQILEFYVNNIYFGNGYYGIQAAANGYFRKGIKSLSLSQTAFLCGITNNPTIYDPYNSFEDAIERRDLILSQLYKDGVITEDEYNEALNEKIKVKKKKKTKSNSVDSFVMESATKALMEKQGFEFRYTFSNDTEKAAYELQYNEAYNQCQASLYTGGYRIYTSIDQDKQTELQKAVDENLAAFTTTYTDSTSGEDMYELQSSATCIDNSTGRVVAIVGGRTQEGLEGLSMNRAFESYRQPGSSIKPLIVYAPALEAGYTPDSIVADTKINEPDAPKNSDGGYMGKITLRKAVEQSRNVVAWKLFEELTPQKGLSYLKKMHYSNIVDSDYVLAASVGGFTYGTNTLEQASGYATLANAGVYREPTCIVSITDSQGDVIISDSLAKVNVYEENAALMMVDVMKGVITSGTGRGLALNNRMPCAGKTGTTDDSKDGWFCGFTKYYTTAVWVGYDIPRTMTGLYGATYPGRIWKQFMNVIHEDLPVADWDKYQSTGTKKNSTEEFEEDTKEKKTTEEPEEEDDEDLQEEDETIVTEAPLVTEAPIVTQAPPVQQEPVVTEAPAQQQTQAPVVTEAPAQQQTQAPVVTEAPPVQQEPVTPEAPIEDPNAATP